MKCWVGVWRLAENPLSQPGNEPGTLTESLLRLSAQVTTRLAVGGQFELPLRFRSSFYGNFISSKPPHPLPLSSALAHCPSRHPSRFPALFPVRPPGSILLRVVGREAKEVQKELAAAAAESHQAWLRVALGLEVRAAGTPRCCNRTDQACWACPSFDTCRRKPRVRGGYEVPTRHLSGPSLRHLSALDCAQVGSGVRADNLRRS